MINSICGPVFSSRFKISEEKKYEKMPPHGVWQVGPGSDYMAWALWGAFNALFYSISASIAPST